MIMIRQNCNLISNVDFQDSWGDIVNDSSNSIKLELTFAGGKKDLLNTPEHIYDSDMLTTLTIALKQRFTVKMQL